MEDFIGEYFGDSVSADEECYICYSKEHLRKCICNNYICENCIREKNNKNCINDCYTFKDNEKNIKNYYNISKYSLPKNFNAQIHFSAVDWIRTGITFDKSIANETEDFNCPKYPIFYILENLSEFYEGEQGIWLTYFDSQTPLKADDYLNIQLKNGELRFFLNGNDLGKSYNLDKNILDKYDEMYLLVHRRNEKSNCEIIYIYDITDE